MFMPIHETSQATLELYHRKMICLDEEELKINGNFDTSVADLLNIQLIKCNSRSDCKSDEEILAFFRNKFLVILYNTIRFD